MQTRDRYSFPAPLTQAIISTLGALPWQQVNGLMAAIQAEVQQQEAPLPSPPPPQAPATP